MLQQLKQTGVESMSARSEYVAHWSRWQKTYLKHRHKRVEHKDGKAKTLYSFDELTGKVESRVYDDKGTLVRYNGKHLNDDSQYKTNIIFQLETRMTQSKTPLMP
ncbi:hypothetical protein BSPWISOXPB_245 [uncultured Gammaproteobacteria bacterium]|nr:hypothetical protein BSPWISOXPB_245 [uncultured Gammaproteobacteria bacterium]